MSRGASVEGACDSSGVARVRGRTCSPQAVAAAVSRYITNDIAIHSGRAPAKKRCVSCRQASACRNDTDTTAAIAGGLAGLRFGARSILTDWLDGLRGRDVVDPLAARLVRRLDASREPALPAMDPDFSFSISDMERIHDNREWERIHRRGGRADA